MKPIHVVAAVGGLAIAGVLAWFFYMQANPPYETTDVRGLGEEGHDRRRGVSRTELP